MSDEYRSLLLFLNRGASSPEQTATAKTGAEHTDEYEFTMKLDRIERTPPAFQQASDDYAGGKHFTDTSCPRTFLKRQGCARE